MAKRDSRVLAIFRTGEEKIIPRDEAVQFIEAQQARYGGEKSGFSCIVITQEATWRKVIHRYVLVDTNRGPRPFRSTQRLGFAGMELVNQ